MREKILEIIAQIRPDLELSYGDKLLADGNLDSFDLVCLMEEVSAAFEIEIDGAQLIPENFESLSAIEALVLRVKSDSKP